MTPMKRPSALILTSRGPFGILKKKTDVNPGNMLEPCPFGAYILQRDFREERGGSDMGAAVTVKGVQIEEKERQAYVDYLEKKHNRKLKKLEIEIDGDFANLTYEWEPVPFERIRRITGYLVGTMDQWNDAKTAEEADRVKHGIGDGMERL